MRSLPLRLLHSRRGQVLVYLVMILLILLVIGIFIFDLQGFIRLRARTQTGVDAAALTAASWQGRSLNMIGELNLLKASTLMLGGLPGGSNDLAANDALLTQMQTRIAYAGPLLGYAAAQQAAKKNGMRSVNSYSQQLIAHAGTWVAHIYPTLYNSPAYGYDWLNPNLSPPPYQDMLEELGHNGMAVKTTNTRYLRSEPSLSGPWAWLIANPTFYNAVNSRMYCWFIQNGINSDTPVDFSQIDLAGQGNPYFVGSEFLNLYVSYQTNLDPRADVADLMSARGLGTLPANTPGLAEIRWATYDLNTSNGAGWADTGIYLGMNQYLRSDFRTEYVYAGAAARMEGMTKPTLLTGRWGWNYDNPDAANDSLGRAQAPAVGSQGARPLWGGSTDVGGSGQNFSAYAQRLGRAEDQLATLQDKESVVSVGAAKPFGALDNSPPMFSTIVLPVFTQVRLIPASLVKESSLDSLDPDFILFLLNYFGNTNYPNIPPDELAALHLQFPQYMGAIDQFLTPDSAFRQGWKAFDDYRAEAMSGPGPDLKSGTADDGCDPCNPNCPPPPPVTAPGGTGTGTGSGTGGRGTIPPPPPSSGGPDILH